MNHSDIRSNQDPPWAEASPAADADGADMCDEMEVATGAGPAATTKRHQPDEGGDVEQQQPKRLRGEQEVQQEGAASGRRRRHARARHAQLRRRPRRLRGKEGRKSRANGRSMTPVADGRPTPDADARVNLR